MTATAPASILQLPPVGPALAAMAPVILSAEALAFVQALEQQFGARRQALLAQRAARQQALDAGQLPDFLAETAAIRAAAWQVAPAPADLHDRRVEITGPVDRKMVINALNSGARVFMADFEDSNTPTWPNLLEGQQNLYDAVRRSIHYTSPEGKVYRLNEQPAVLVVRPRGWHLDEKHVLLDGRASSGALFDFGLYFYHNAKALLARGSGPYFYLPKLESHLEARLWNDVFIFAQDYIGIPQGSIRATVLIETILAAFEMEEILYELRDHASGLNCGRWDYIFSYIKKLHAHPDRVLPERGQVTMTTHFLRSYSHLAIATCHRRGAYAMGGMSAFIPIKHDSTANAAALEQVRQDKLREAGDGHDGTWVAHPGLVPVAMAVFDELMPTPNQLHKTYTDLHITATDLLQVPAGSITVAGVRNNIEVAIRYLESWLRGQGCVPIHNLMEDAATAEIARAQVWQWLHTPGLQLADGTPFTVERYTQLYDQVVQELKAVAGDTAFLHGTYRRAATLFDNLVRSAHFTEFLTLPAYAQLE